MNRDNIIALIREHYDPEPKDWPRHRGWDDGAGDIADKILGQMVERPVADMWECPKCGLKAKTSVHRFCTYSFCPPREAVSSHDRVQTPINKGD